MPHPSRFHGSFPLILVVSLSGGCAKSDGGEGTSAGTGASSGTSGTGGSTGATDGSGSTSSSGTGSSGTTGSTGTTTSGGTSTSSTTGSEDTGAVFVEMPDGGGAAVECDIYAQDCKDGEKCMPWANDGGNAWNATKCVPVDASPVATGDPCMVQGSGVSGIDNCDVGAMCWNADPNGIGACIDLCTGSPATPTCPDSDTICVIFNDGTLPVCLSLCDPLISDCGEREVCRPDFSNDQFVCSNDASGTAGAFGDPCEFGNACDPGLFCANVDQVPGCSGSTGCCSEYCDVSDPMASSMCAGAAGGQECIAWYAEGTAPPGRENVGACGIPS